LARIRFVFDGGGGIRRAASRLIDQGCRQALGSTERRLDLLLVDRVDRLSRKVRQRQRGRGTRQLEVVLKLATEPFRRARPPRRMMVWILGVFAEFEHASIVDRVTNG
jgi:site-specific DNA recombinase